MNPTVSFRFSHNKPYTKLNDSQQQTFISHSWVCALTEMTLLQVQVCSVGLSLWDQQLPRHMAATSWQITDTHKYRPSSASTYKTSPTSHLLMYCWPKHSMTKPKACLCSNKTLSMDTNLNFPLTSTHHKMLLFSPMI